MASPPLFEINKQVVNLINEDTQEKYKEAEAAITGDDNMSKALKALIIAKSDDEDLRREEVEKLLKSLTLENDVRMIAYIAYSTMGYKKHAQNVFSDIFGADRVDDSDENAASVASEPSVASEAALVASEPSVAEPSVVAEPEAAPSVASSSVASSSVVAEPSVAAPTQEGGRSKKQKPKPRRVTKKKEKKPLRS